MHLSEFLEPFDPNVVCYLNCYKEQVDITTGLRWDERIVNRYGRIGEIPMKYAYGEIKNVYQESESSPLRIDIKLK